MTSFNITRVNIIDKSGSLKEVVETVYDKNGYELIATISRDAIQGAKMTGYTARGFDPLNALSKSNDFYFINDAQKLNNVSYYGHYKYQDGFDIQGFQNHANEIHQSNANWNLGYIDENIAEPSGNIEIRIDTFYNDWIS